MESRTFDHSSEGGHTGVLVYIGSVDIMTVERHDVVLVRDFLYSHGFFGATEVVVDGDILHVFAQVENGNYTERNKSAIQKWKQEVSK